MQRSKTSLYTASILGLAVLAVAISAGAGLLASEKNPNNSRAYLHSYNLNSSGLAIEGYCPVTYFTEGQAQPGDPQITATHNNVDYRFASESAREAFQQNPDRYIPAFGGWCAFGMAIEDKFPVDPTNFKIVDGRLFLFLRNPGVDALELWNNGNEQEQTEAAESHWETVSG